MRVYFGLVAFVLATMLSYSYIGGTNAHKMGINDFKNIINSKNLLKNKNLMNSKNLIKGKNMFNNMKFQSPRSDKPNLPNPSLNKPLNATEIDLLDNDVFITQFLNFIFTGRYDGVSEIGDEFDENSVHVLLKLGIQIYISVVAEDPPDDAAGLGKFLIY